MNKAVRKHILAFGQVQGVGFRYFVYSLANSYKLSGYAKNLTHGGVEIELQGLQKDLDIVIKLIKKGNRFINVEKLEIASCELSDKTGFFIG